MQVVKKPRERKKFEPFYSDIVELSKKKKITLLAARKELVQKDAKRK